jgi:transaldolase
MKQAYRIYHERGYRTRLLSAAYRNDYQWTELMGGDIIMTMPHPWIKKFNESGISRGTPHGDPGRSGDH